MIHPDKHPQALRTLQRLFVEAKYQAHEIGAVSLAELLNDIELLPEFMADDVDRTDEFVEMLQGIAQVHPRCRFLADEFQALPTASQ